MKKILMVDDDVIIRIAFKKVLASGKNIIKQAKTVNEAISYLRAEHFDLILLDLKLPPRGWDAGFQILKKKRKIVLNEETPVIIISGQRDEDYIRSQIDMQDNVAHIFQKPVENEVLQQKIDEVLGRKQEL